MRTVLLAASAAAICAAQTISIEQLKHPVPPGAAREYRASLNALTKGDLPASIAHCRKAIDVDPNNASAHNDLGVLFLDNGQIAQALEEFESAAAIQPGLVAAHLNAGYALLAMERPEGAEASLKKVLEIERNNRRAHLLLGWCLAIQHRYTVAALESLQIASRDYPEAHLAAADVLIHRGAIDGARTEVEAYLATGASDQKTLAEAWLRFLTF